MIQSARLLPLAATILLAAAPGLGHAEGAPWAETRWMETGEASWYGGGFAGQRTSSGERFDPSAMTAAHTTLPLGCRVRVTREDTGASIIVSVNDRLPPHRHRIIDLSRGAAVRLGIARRGIALVTLTPVRPGDVEEVAEVPDERFRRTSRH